MNKRAEPMNAIELLKADHETVKDILSQLSDSIVP